MTSELTIEEMAESLTGFEEVAVEAHFPNDVNGLLEQKPTMGIRALVFTVKTREGLTAPDAKKAAMELTLKQVMAFFAEPEEDFDPDEPESESGKGDSPSA